jgi:hypothetical protein
MTVRRRPRWLGILVAVMAMIATLLSSAGVATANQPDAVDEAIRIDQLPYYDERHVGPTTGSSDDPSCSGRGAAVRYAFRPSTDMTIVASTAGSAYDTTLSVYRGSRQLVCDDDSQGLQSRIRVELEAGVDHLIVVASCCGRGAGDLRLHVRERHDPVVDFTVHPTATRPPGSVRPTVRGTVNCSRPTAVQLEVRLRSDVAGASGMTHGYAEVLCDGVTRWKTPVVANGVFATGSAIVAATTLACDETGACHVDEHGGHVRLIR